MASSQPTMNNFTFGNDRYQYYETIAGGSGAGGEFDAQGRLTGGFDGTSVVQTHMTNSRLTDPEVLEFRFPVRLESYAIRAGSGGVGQWRGGDGGVRRVRFLEPMTASILSNGRALGAFGMARGQAGQAGINRVVRADGVQRHVWRSAHARVLPVHVAECARHRQAVRCSSGRHVGLSRPHAGDVLFSGVRSHAAACQPHALRLVAQRLVRHRQRPRSVARPRDVRRSRRGERRHVIRCCLFSVSVLMTRRQLLRQKGGGVPRCCDERVAVAQKGTNGGAAAVVR
jgi:hypothetical protein